MKNRILVITTLTLITAILPSVAKGADTGTLLLQGIVSAVNNITITPNGSNNTSLNITSGVSNYLVASVSETSNNLTGYKINAKSTNAGELRNTGDASKKTTYTIAYGGGSPLSLTSNYQQVKNVNALTGLTTASSTVHANVAAYAAAPSGTYSDTVTFQIVANP